MIRASLQLGKTPLMRRLVAAAILIIAAVCVAYWRSDGGPIWFDLAANLVAAAAALLFLHYRWSSHEKRTVSPRQAEDIFS